MAALTDLILFSDNATNSRARLPSDLVNYLASQPEMRVTNVSIDRQDIDRCVLQTEGNMSILCIPRPENKFELDPAHNFHQLTYARRIVDVLYSYLLGKEIIVFCADSVKYLRIFEKLKERYRSARFIYLHYEWSWKLHLHIPDKLFAELWRAGDISRSPLAFELTAYERKMALTSDKVIAVSGQAIDFFSTVLEIPMDRLSLIRNAATSCCKGPTSNMFRKDFGLEEDEKIILYAGNITHGDGIFYLVRAFKIIAADDERVKLVIVGSGDYSGLLEFVGPLWGKIILTGQLPDNVLGELITMADIGVIPSLYGQYSVTAMDMSLGRLPLVISAVDGLDESFEDRVDSLKTSLLVNEQNELQIDVSQLVKNMRLLLDDRILARILSENAYARGIKKSDLSRMCGSYLKVLQEVAYG
ncbi:glycosyltransferase family 4 protein [Flavitalea sp. BT771]|uniref:glycosyltransferase family 4 protein n=1 Tax=Flavitalea sp. BT771 TaxID=3063329 RepID=UPI0026E44DE9|nr:glycosyltransferase family 4 protein [Flavitalea sp. BT771]MDO6434786.1 glycosyltransferase family 4 protein [Flavitalea sp. BT771]MDV6223686.1 glycosyltransferase family 4 protein [Flavitalea sp. BT771]